MMVMAMVKWWEGVLLRHGNANDNFMLMHVHIYMETLLGNLIPLENISSYILYLHATSDHTFRKREREKDCVRERWKEKVRFVEETDLLINC